MIEDALMLSEESLESVIGAAREGSEWAWSAIYGQLAPVLLGYIRAQGSIEAEDVLGEVFAQAVRDLPKFAGDASSFRSWMFVIAHHRLLDERRGKARRPTEPATNETLEMSAPQGGDVETEALTNLASGRVKELIGRLSQPQRSVLLLRILGGLSIDETAVVVGKRPGAVKALQRRGLATLRKEISDKAIDF